MDINILHKMLSLVLQYHTPALLNLFTAMHHVLMPNDEYYYKPVHMRILVVIQYVTQYKCLSNLHVNIKGFFQADINTFPPRGSPLTSKIVWR